MCPKRTNPLWNSSFAFSYLILNIGAFYSGEKKKKFTQNLIFFK